MHLLPKQFQDSGVMWKNAYEKQMLNDKVCRRSRWQHKFGLFCLMTTFFVNTNGRKLHTSMTFLSITIVRENQLNALCRHATEVRNRSPQRKSLQTLSHRVLPSSQQTLSVVCKHLTSCLFRTVYNLYDSYSLQLFLLINQQYSILSQAVPVRHYFSVSLLCF